MFRKQSINVGFFDQDKNFVEHTNIVLQDRELTEVKQFVGMQMPEAIMVNSSDHGFGVFVIDDKSIRFFEENLEKIDNQLNKAVVIGQLLIMMRQILYPATRLPLILNQMMEE